MNADRAVPAAGRQLWGARPGGRLQLLAILLAAAAPPAAARAQRMDPTPKELEGVGIEERVGQKLPLELTFLDDRGRRVRLGDFFQGERPVILSLTYSSCPMLCHLQLQGLVDVLKAMPWSPGEEFEIVNVSIDAGERWEQARKTKVKHVEEYGRTETAAGWHFLVGEHVRQLADAVGFHYKYLPETGQYAHAAGLILCTPDGQVSRYLYGVQYDPQTLRLSLVEAGQGKVGGTVDRVLLFCFHYDAEAGRYGPAAVRLMRLGGLLTLAALLLGVAPYWVRSRRGRRAPAAGDGGPPPGAAEGGSAPAG